MAQLLDHGTALSGQASPQSFRRPLLIIAYKYHILVYRSFPQCMVSIIQCTYRIWERDKYWTRITPSTFFDITLYHVQNVNPNGTKSCLMKRSDIIPCTGQKYNYMMSDQILNMSDHFENTRTLRPCIWKSYYEHCYTVISTCIGTKPNQLVSTVINDVPALQS